MRVRICAALPALVWDGEVRRSTCVIVLTLFAALCSLGCGSAPTYRDYIGTWTAGSRALAPEVTEVTVDPYGAGEIAFTYADREARCRLDWKMKHKSLVGMRHGDLSGKELVTLTLANGRMSGTMKDPGAVATDPRPGEAAPGQVVVTFQMGKWEARFAGFTRRPTADP